MYAKEYHESFYAKEIRNFAPSLDLILRNTDQKRLLDFGCGSGAFLTQARARGFQTTGVEFDKELVSKLTKELPEIHFMTLEDFLNDEPHKFDVIHLGDVLEHLNNPIEVLGLLKSRLGANGIFILEGPLETNHSVALFFRRAFFFIRSLLSPGRIANHPPYHTFFANVHNQVAFFESHGIRTLYTSISEEPWPYVSTFKEVRSIAGAIKYIIAQISIQISRGIPQWGNRILYLGRAVGSAT